MIQQVFIEALMAARTDRVGAAGHNRTPPSKQSVTNDAADTRVTGHLQTPGVSYKK